MTINIVGVVGAGTMGNGIAQVFAQSGFTVKIHDAAPGAVDRARKTIDKSLAKFVEKGKVSAADRDAALARLHPASSLDELADVDFVVEAIIESLEHKRELLGRLDAIAKRLPTGNSPLLSKEGLDAIAKRLRTGWFVDPPPTAPAPRATPPHSKKCACMPHHVMRLRAA